MSRSGVRHLLPGGRGEQSAYEAADRYWDAVVLGEPLSTEVIDPTLAKTIHHLHTVDDAPLPDAAFAARLEDELLRQPAPVRHAPANFNAGSRSADQDTRFIAAGWPSRTRRMTMNVAGAAALLAIIVTSTLVALWAGPLAGPDRDRLPIVLAPGITDEKLLLQARFDTIPDGMLSATISRWVLQPGAEVVMGRQETGHSAPAAYLVETGALSVLPDVSVPVTRGDATTPTAVPEAAWTTLLPGDRMFVPADGTSLWRNDGDHSVRILEATFAPREVQPQPAGVLNYRVIDEWPYANPDLPVIMSVIKITLHPEGELPTDVVPGMAMLKPEAGRLVAIDVDGAGNPLPPIGVTQATRFLGSFPPGRIFRSGNNAPVTLLLVTIQDANPLGAGT